MSLSKFIEDYLEYQVDYAIRELNSIGGGESQQRDQPEQRAQPNQPQTNTSKEDLVSKSSAEGPKGQLAANFLKAVNTEDMNVS